MKQIDIKLKIGEFSKLCQVTVKTLRHYEEIGLLAPHEVDQWSGYRYYDVSQLAQMTEIHHLKSLGFTLEEIKEMWEDDITIPTVEMVNDKLNICEDELRRLQKRRDDLIALKSSHKHKIEMENITIKSLPAIVIASYRGTVKNYGELFNLCPNVIGPEMERLGCECPEPGYCYTFNHDKEYRETDIDIEYCEQVKKAGNDSDIIKFKNIPAVEKAICYKHYGSYDKFPQAWTNLYKYMEEQGYKIADNPRFNYIDGVWNKESEEEWLTEIQVPVVSK